MLFKFFISVIFHIGCQSFISGFYDFTVRSEESCPGLINLIGIESPGLTASDPLAKIVCKMVTDLIPAGINPNFDPTEKPKLRFRDLDDEKRQELIESDPNWGEIVCRCNNVTRAEILAAANNPLGVKTLAGIKYRTRAAMGRCASGYCLGRIADLLVSECGLSPDGIVLRSPKGKLFFGGEK